MTRINLVAVAHLCDQHLLAETRELTRIPNNIIKGKYDMRGQPSEYTLGVGHVKFFYDKLSWLCYRYCDLIHECKLRGFNVKDLWPDSLLDRMKISRLSNDLWNDYVPTQEAIEINKQRIIERMPAKARWTNRERPAWAVKGE